VKRFCIISTVCIFISLTYASIDKKLIDLPVSQVVDTLYVSSHSTIANLYSQHIHNQMGTGSPKGYNSVIPNSLLRTCSESLHRALSLSYRLSSSPPFKAANPFPAALLDALAGYNYLINDIGFSPQNVVISGDSAGGHLVLALVRYLVENDIPTLPVPGALILFSPAADWGGSHDQSSLSTTDESHTFPSMRRNAPTDYVVPFFKTGYSGRSILGALPPSALRTNPYLSPASLEIELSPSSPTQPGSIKNLFTGFPPTCILVGGAEILLDSIRTLRDRMKASIGDGPNGMLYLEFEDALHVFPVLEWHEPERGIALGRLAQWLSSLQKNGDEGHDSKE
jgi:acetyl esterase/lipase